MIEELGPEARALLDAAREGMSPDAAAVRRVRARIEVAVGGAAAGTAMGVKLGILAFVAAVGAGAGLYLTRGSAAAMAPAIELASPSEVPLQAAVREPAAPAISDEDLITIATPPVPAPARAAPARAVRRVAPPAPSRDESARAPDTGPPARPSSPRATRDERSAIAEGDPDGVAGRAGGHPRGINLAREVELLDVAMAALRRGDATNALKAVRQHALETAGRGQLAEDAAAIEIEALCHLHDPTTNAKLEAFDARFPRSAQRSRLDNKCP